MTFHSPIVDPIVDPSVGYAYFDGFKFRCGSWYDSRKDRVMPILGEEQLFICRQMSQTVEQLRNKLQRGLNVLDIGTGSGIFAIYLDRLLNSGKFAELSNIYALDRNSRALEVVNVNRQINNSRNIRILEPQLYNKESVKPNSQDVMLVNPPYNFTPPFLQDKVAIHAEAGDIGMSVFRDWMPSIPLHLSNDGVFIGSHFSPVRDGKMVALQELIQALGGNSKIHYCRFLPDNCDTYRFLTGEYQDYLENLSLAEKHKLKDWIEKVATEFPQMSVIYFEAYKTGGQGEIIEDIIPIYSCEVSWDDRINTHRIIVNQVQF